MKLTKENVYISLRGKTKEELTDLYDFLKINNEPIFKTKEGFLKYDDYYLAFFGEWQQMFRIDNEVEVTIEQLKEILYPMETLQEKAIRLENELEEVRKEIEEENNIKIGDWVYMKGLNIWKIMDRQDITHASLRNCEKITDTILVESLNRLF